MANSTAGIIDTVSASQMTKEITVNQYADAVSPANFLGRRASLCAGLVWGFYGGTMLVDGVLTQIYLSTSNTTVLSASTTTYLELTRSGVINKATGSFTPGNIPLYEIVTGASTVTSYTDYRAWSHLGMTSNASVAVTSADVTLTAAQASCRHLTTTGVLTGDRNVIVPNNWEGKVFCNNTGAYTTTIKTSGGTGIVVGQGKRAFLSADGTNVVRDSADA